MAQKKAGNLEDFLAGKPLNENMARLMRGEEEDSAAKEPMARGRNFADGKPLTAQDRKQLERMLGGAGWQVLLKLLDTEILALEDAAKARSLENPRDPALQDLWADVAGLAKARNRIARIAETECTTGTTKTAAETN